MRQLENRKSVLMKAETLDGLIASFVGLGDASIIVAKDEDDHAPVQWTIS